MSRGKLLVLAWPETKVYKTGAWYDGFMQLLGFAKNGYYVVGHAAVVLLREGDAEALYFDFGRYHTPLGTGRVRDKVTDPDVTVVTSVHWEQGEVVNIEELLLELAQNKATHGKGKMVVSCFNTANITAAFERAKAYQAKEAISYGPFVPFGTNCSRFVAAVVRASLPLALKRLLLHVPYVVSPSPISNVKMANSYYEYFIVEGRELQKRTSLISRLYNPFAKKYTR